MTSTFILWFMVTSFNSLTLLQFDTREECEAAGKSIVADYNGAGHWVQLDTANYRCIEVKR